MPRLAATLWVALLSARAWAEAPSSEQAADAETSRQTAIYFNFGFGTPEGIVGLEAVHRFGEYFELAAGIGEGVGAGQANAQWSIMPRVRPGGPDHPHFTLGAGMSGGPYATQLNFCVTLCDFPGASPPTTVPTFYTLWTNVEIGGEYWSRGGFAFRYYIGYAHGIPLSSPPPGNPLYPSINLGLDIPYFGIGLGYAF
jgi:hypothetical protein